MDVLKSLFDGDIRPFEQSGKLTPEALTLMKDLLTKIKRKFQQLPP